jgi:hypothetical protein
MTKLYGYEEARHFLAKICVGKQYIIALGRLTESERAILRTGDSFGVWSEAELNNFAND